jgi:peptide/nickel transport system substrate-binding protein
MSIGVLRRALSCATVVVVVGAAALAGGATNASAAGSGGSLTVLENSGYIGNWPGLDPATDTNDVANNPYMDAIYGDLFEQGPNNKPIPDLATGYKITNGGLTVTITLRSGVTFSDGTPFNSTAVMQNIQRDLDPANANACGCVPNFPVASMSAPNPTTFVMQLKTPYAPIIEAFYNSGPNWTPSPTALAKMGETAFALNPVGAGPFTVVSDKPSSELQLAANPHYWQKGAPKLSSLTFTSIGSDESAYEAIQAGQAGAYQRFQTYSLIKTIKSKLTVAQTPATQPGVIQLNTTIAPFNNLTAREAIYYATDPNAINTSLLYGTGIVTQSMTGPGAANFYSPKVPGYRTYNPAKAKALVKQLGGLSVALTIVSSPLEVQFAEALKSEWAAAGINATIASDNIGQAIAAFKADSWQAGVPFPGSFDPSIGTGLGEYLSTSLLTGVKNPAMDALIAKATSGTASARAATFKQIWKLASDQAYGPFLPIPPVYQIAAKGVSGPGLTTTAPQIFWEAVTSK